MYREITSTFKSLKYHFYADYTQVYCHITLHNAKTTFNHVEKCLSEIQLWMNSNKLKLNPSTTEFIVCGAAALQKRFEPLLPIHILFETFGSIELVQNLGVIFDWDFSFKEQVDIICMSCFVGLQNVWRIVLYLPKIVAISAANALVSRRMTTVIHYTGIYPKVT